MMHKKVFLILAISLGMLPTDFAFGQFTRVLYKTIPLEGLDSLVVDLSFETSQETWASNQLMIETNIQLFQVRQGILENLLENGRYDIDSKASSKTLKLANTPVNALASPVREVIQVKLYIPDTFREISPGVWLKTSP